jgi:peroxiredoxin
MSRKTKVRRYGIAVSALLGVTVVALLAVNLLLLAQNRRLKASVAAQPETTTLLRGTTVPAFQGRTWLGEEVRVDFDTQRRVLFFFSPECHWCKQTRSVWNEIVRTMDRSRFQPVAIATQPDGAQEFVVGTSLETIPLLVDFPEDLLEQYNIGIVPQTIVVDSSGRIEHAWAGAFREADESALEDLFGTDLQPITTAQYDLAAGE